MKASRYIAIALVIVTVLLVAGWFLRNTIIERISNPMLAQYDLVVTDVSLDALASSYASISYLELEHVKGATIAIDELTLPIGTSSTGFNNFRAEKITIELPETGDDEPLDLANALGQFLALPLQLPQSEIVVGEVSVSPYPVIRDLRWQLTEENQLLTALADTISLTANVARTSDTNHILNVSFTDSLAATAEQSITVKMQRTYTGISLTGTATLDLPRWTPVSRLLDVDSIDVASGSATLRFDAEIENSPEQPPLVYADFTPTTPVHFTYPRAADAITSITVESASTIEISASFPDGQWSLRQVEASLRVSDGDWRDISVSLINLSCQSGINCSADFSIMMENAVTPFADVARFELTATQDVEIGDEGTRVLVRPSATLDIRGISGADLELARFKGQLTSAAELRIGDTGWQFTAQSADLGIEEFSVLDELGFSAQVFLDDISFSDENQQQSMKFGAYASSSMASLGDQTIRLPGFKGGIVRQGTEVAVFLETNGLFDEASVEASHNLDNETGQLSLMGAGLSFDAQDISSRVAPWPYDWNFSAGILAIDLHAGWQNEGKEWQINAQTSVRLTDLAGAWDDTAFAGLSTTIDAGFDTATGITMQPSTIDVALIEMGLPVENITASYALRPDALAVDVDNLRMTAFGGVVTADPFSFSTANERNNLLIHARSIDLAEILSIKEFKAVEISGSIGAE